MKYQQHSTLSKQVKEDGVIICYGRTIQPQPLNEPVD